MRIRNFLVALASERCNLKKKLKLEEEVENTEMERKV